MTHRAVLSFVIWITVLAPGSGWAQDDPLIPARQAAALADFQKAVSEGRLLGTGGARDLLKAVQSLAPAEWETERGVLVDALRRPAALVVTRYTQGDEIPQATA